MNQVLQQMYFGMGALNRDRERRMAFYGRVSTPHEAQIEALNNQMQWYDDQLQYHSNWTLCGRYIDEGITGTLAKKRPAFMKMIEDAKQGKFDLIVTREVCRFARNTVDTLTLTRELKNYGVEVYFVSDNIWTMDGDGELRLSIMATMAQEESRKISERVLAGQMVSRQKGVLYGSGNIIGYDRVKDTYEINQEQAETVRTIYNLYEKGYGEKAIVNELCRLGCKDGCGKVNWSCVKISRILHNATYMGYICYNKSRVNNYLEKKRIKNLDEDSIVMIKGNFEPIISEEQWHNCERIRKGRIATYRCPNGEERRKGTKGTRYMWVRKLKCRCGSSYRRFHWRTLLDGTPVYGYQCSKRTSNPTRTFSLEHGLADQLNCDAISVPQWKLEMMATFIFRAIWGDQRETILKTYELICEAKAQVEKRAIATAAVSREKYEKIKRRKLRYKEMLADGDLSREEYNILCSKAEQDLTVTDNQQSAEFGNVKAQCDLNKIRKALDSLVDVSGPVVNDALIDRFVEVTTPVENYFYRWRLNFDKQSDAKGAESLMEIQGIPLLKFTITFDEAKKYRKENHMPAQFRRCSWTDLQVEVYA